MWAVPVEFLSDQEAAAFARYGDSVGQAYLERLFFLDDAERELVAGLRGDHNRLGFSVQLGTARYLGRFLADPLEGAPTEVLDFLAAQLRIGIPSGVGSDRARPVLLTGLARRFPGDSAAQAGSWPSSMARR